VLRRQSLLGGKAIQRYVGYAALALLAVRFVWGFIGTRHAGTTLPSTDYGVANGLAGGRPRVRMVDDARRLLGQRDARGAQDFVANTIMVFAGVPPWPFSKVGTSGKTSYGRW
jgi:hypothetical protein